MSKKDIKCIRELLNGDKLKTKIVKSSKSSTSGRTVSEESVHILKYPSKCHSHTHPLTIRLSDRAYIFFLY